jgi:hypothetical protein
MKMVNMAMKPEKKGEGKSDCCCCAGPCGCEGDKPRYPWGLQLRLENEQLDALGMKDMPKTGETMMISCMVKVTQCGEEEREGEEPSRNVSLQIVEMGVEMPEMKKAPMDMNKAAAALYEKKAEA